MHVTDYANKTFSNKSNNKTTAREVNLSFSADSNSRDSQLFKVWQWASHQLQLYR